MRGVFKTLFLVTAVILTSFSVLSVPIDGEFVEYEGDEAWIKYSPSPNFDSPSNNHNLIVGGDTSEIREILENNVNGGWSEAEGTERYANVNGEWVLDDYQLEKGHYFTNRYHLRGYEASNMTLIQAHYEHFDWFQLGHEVESNTEAREFLINGSEAEGYEIEMFRSESNTFLDSDGWIAFVVLASVFAAVNMSGYSRNISDYFTPLAGFISLFAFIRFIPVDLYNFLSPHQIFALIYPVILIGMPALAYFYGRSRKGILPGLTVFSGFTVAFMLDYLYLGVGSIPFEIISHRLSAAASLGIMGYGSNLEDTKYLYLGLCLWALTVLTGLMLI